MPWILHVDLSSRLNSPRQQIHNLVEALTKLSCRMPYLPLHGELALRSVRTTPDREENMFRAKATSNGLYPKHLGLWEKDLMLRVGRFRQLRLLWRLPHTIKLDGNGWKERRHKNVPRHAAAALVALGAQSISNHLCRIRDVGEPYARQYLSTTCLPGPVQAKRTSDRSDEPQPHKR